jgi:hypothetical protein
LANITANNEFLVDPRLTLMCQAMPRYEAIGSIICLWEVGQSYWKKDEGLIPKNIYFLLHRASDLLRYGFASEEPEGIYCNGAREKWAFLLKRSESGKLGGKRSAESRKAKFGSAIPKNARNKPKHDRSTTEASTEAQPNDFEAHRSGPKPSSSSSSSSSGSASSSDTKKLAALPPPLIDLWNAHCGPMTRAISISEERQKKWARRWKEKPDRGYWEAVIERMAQTPFFAGKSKSGWKGDVDWLLQTDSALKVMEGKYDSGPGTAAGKPFGQQIADINQQTVEQLRREGKI